MDHMLNKKYDLYQTLCQDEEAKPQQERENSGIIVVFSFLNETFSVKAMLSDVND
ncbi:hypothetical protein [Trabulsiella odontotermitis]|uniref:hypothetical protein n=1 Tax=Trabulsiella odontotermitis TaxID=379893 RepID=UPI000A690F92|nr:hypothetical protein [Trabulsiella odontotermitis]